MVLQEQGFDAWAKNYEQTVQESNQQNRYPFAGYEEVLKQIFQQIRNYSSAAVLDIGIGTAKLSTALYENGHSITGVDFSSEMLEIAKERMPQATLIQADFTKGLPETIKQQQYDVIVATYALHHVDDNEKVTYLSEWRDVLREGGQIFIGDISFTTQEELKNCQTASQNEWDDEEYYMVFEEVKEALSFFTKVDYQQISHCAGILSLTK